MRAGRGGNDRAEGPVGRGDRGADRRARRRRRSARAHGHGGAGASRGPTPRASSSTAPWSWRVVGSGERHDRPPPLVRSRARGELDAGADAAGAFRRHRRHRHERHRRTARQSRVRGHGFGREGIGCDARLAQLGVEVQLGHDAAHVGAADVVVVSSAIAGTNPEIVEARRRRIPVIPRAEMLAELMRLRYGIAIAGAHGKTTTTSMVALVLERAGLDPTAVIGGRLSAFGSNARLGQGAVDGRRGGRERPLVPQALAGDRAGHEHRSRAHGGLRQLGGAPGRVPRVHQQGAVLRRRGPVHRRRGGAGAGAARDPARDHLRPRRAGIASPTSPATTCSSSRSARAARSVQTVDGREIELGPVAAAGPRPSQPAQRARRCRDRPRAPGAVPRASRRRWRSSAAPNGASRCAASGAA